MKKIIALYTLFFSLLLTACTKEVSENFNAYPNHPNNDTAWVKEPSSTAAIHQLFDNIKNHYSITDSVDGIMGGKIKINDSIELSFQPNSFIKAGTNGVVDGFIKIDIGLLQTKSDFIKALKSTMHYDGRIVETGGGFFIKFSKDGKPVQLAANTDFECDIIDRNFPKQNMQVFLGKDGYQAPTTGIDTAFHWKRSLDTSYLPVWYKSGSGGAGGNIGGYKFKISNSNWVLAGKFTNQSQSSAKLTVLLPPNFNNKNTIVFAVYDQQQVVLNLKPDFASRSFSIANIPLNTSLRIISISKIGDSYYYEKESVSSFSNQVGYYKLTPEKKSLSEIVKAIEGL